MATASFQKEIQKKQAKGIQGDKATLNPVVYADRNYVVDADDTVTIGNFVWAVDTQPDGNVWRATNTGTGAPLGLVERWLGYFNFNLLDGGTLIVPKNSALKIVRRGDMFAVSTTAATVGQKVFAKLADGTLVTGAAESTISGAVETTWSVMEGGEIGDIIVISNWS